MTPTPSVTSSNDDASSMHSVASKHTLVDTPEDSALVIHLVLPGFHPEDSFSRDIALSRLFPETGNIGQGSFAANWQTNILQVVVIKQVAAALMHISVSRKKITAYTDRLSQLLRDADYQWFQFARNDDPTNIFNLAELLHKLDAATHRAAPRGVRYKVALRLNGPARQFVDRIFTYESRDELFFVKGSNVALEDPLQDRPTVPATIPATVPVVETVDETSYLASTAQTTPSTVKTVANNNVTNNITPLPAVSAVPAAVSAVTPSPATTTASVPPHTTPASSSPTANPSDDDASVVSDLGSVVSASSTLSAFTSPAQFIRHGRRILQRGASRLRGQQSPASPVTIAGVTPIPEETSQEVAAEQSSVSAPSVVPSPVDTPPIDITITPVPQVSIPPVVVPTEPRPASRQSLRSSQDARYSESSTAPSPVDFGDPMSRPATGMSPTTPRMKVSPAIARAWNNFRAMQSARADRARTSGTDSDHTWMGGYGDMRTLWTRGKARSTVNDTPYDTAGIPPPGGGDGEGNGPPGPSLPSADPDWESPDRDGFEYDGKPVPLNEEPPFDGPLEGTHWYQFICRPLDATRYLDPTTQKLLPWIAVRIGFGRVLNFPAQYEINYSTQRDFLRMFSTYRVFREDIHGKRFFTRLPRYSTDASSSYLEKQRSLLMYLNVFQNHCTEFAVYAPPLWSFQAGDYYGAMFPHLPISVQSNAHLVFSSLLRDAMRYVLSKHIEFQGILAADNGYQIIYNLARFAGHPQLQEVPIQHATPVQSKDMSLQEYSIKWSHFLQVSILGGTYYSDRYFVQQFVDNLHPSVQKLIGTRITTGVNRFSLAMPLPTEYSPQQLLVTIMEHLRNQRAMALATKSPRDFEKDRTPIHQLIDAASTTSIHAVTSGNAQPSRTELKCYLCEANHMLSACPLLKQLLKDSDPRRAKVVLRTLENGIKNKQVKTPAQHVREIIAALDSAPDCDCHGVSDSACDSDALADVAQMIAAIGTDANQGGDTGVDSTSTPDDDSDFRTGH